MELLKKLTQTHSPSGNEKKVSNLIADTVAPFADEVYSDNMGNLIAHKKGNGKKVLLASHIDEIGILANYIDDNGFVRFSPLGGVMPYCALYQSVVFQNGTKGIVAYEEKESLTKDFSFRKMYIDIGAKSTEEAQKLISIGDSAVFEGAFFCNGDKVVSKALDDRIGAYILIKVLMELKDSPNDLYFAFTVQEELGCRGAKVVANAINPDIALAVDVTDTGDTPECRRMAIKQGSGPCIKYMDNSIITHKYVNDALKTAADKEGIALQHEVLTLGGTDAGAIHTSGTGVMTGAVSIPTRYIHTPRECVSMADVDGAIGLIAAFAKSSL